MGVNVSNDIYTCISSEEDMRFPPKNLCILLGWVSTEIAQRIANMNL